MLYSYGAVPPIALKVKVASVLHVILLAITNVGSTLAGSLITTLALGCEVQLSPSTTVTEYVPAAKPEKTGLVCASDEITGLSDR